MKNDVEFLEVKLYSLKGNNCRGDVLSLQEALDEVTKEGLRPLTNKELVLLWEKGFRTDERVLSLGSLSGKNVRPKILSLCGEDIRSMFYSWESHLFSKGTKLIVTLKDKG